MSGEIATGSSLGKRRRSEGQQGNTEEDGPERQSSTLFVSNLPYTATSTDLQTLFSDLAPVRSAFVVLEGGVSKGVGYVSFAIKEDAATALETVQKDGLALNGRKLRVEIAGTKIKHDSSEKTTSPEKKKRAPPTHSYAPQVKDPDAIRTVIISGLPISVDQKTLWKKVRKLDDAENVTIDDGEKGIAHAVFKTPSAAMRAVEKLHAHIFKGSLLSVVLKKRVDSVTKPKASKSGESSAVGAAAPSRASRLIVRNLPWDITERDLRALFLPYGPIHSINIPVSQPEEDETGKKSKPRARGFAFVWFLSKKDGERAIASANGITVRAGAIIPPTMNKKERARLRRKLRLETAAGGTEGKDEEEDEDAEGKEDGKEESEAEDPKGGRTIAVDWALSKEKWEEAKAREEQEGHSGDEGDAESSSEEAEGSDDESVSEMPSDDSEDTEDSMDEDEDEDEDDEEDRDDVPVKPSLPEPAAGTTLFVRNVPFDATEEEMRTLFRAFGPLRYARITMDHELGRSRGTGFVCFWNVEDADKAVQHSELLKRDAGLEGVKQASNPFKMSSILTPDPSSSFARSLVLRDRTLDVVRAVTRDVATKLREEGLQQREKADKRNLYLLREGVIFPNTPSASLLPPADIDKRVGSFNQRRAQLKSNPSLYVSRTRLSVRRIPPFVTERGLRRLARWAVKAFEEEVKQQKRDPLTPDELRDPEPTGDEEAPVKKQRKPLKEFIKQAKLVRQQDRVDPITGKNRSSGYGFLEMGKHANALRFLRWANNNPTVMESLRVWWKDELAELIEAGQKELKSLVKTGGDEDIRVEKEARLKRMKAEKERLDGLEDGKKGDDRTLIIEFAIENVQVVRRREAKRVEDKPKSKFQPDRTSRRRPEEHSGHDRDEAEEQGDHKEKRQKSKADQSERKPSKWPQSDSHPRKQKSSLSKGVSAKNSASKEPSKIGDVIARKRRERKMKAKKA